MKQEKGVVNTASFFVSENGVFFVVGKRVEKVPILPLKKCRKMACCKISGNCGMDSFKNGSLARFKIRDDK